MNNSNPSHEVYIIHVWRMQVNDTTWRGKIQNVCTGQSVTIANLNKLTTNIRLCFYEDQKKKQKQARGLR